ncbi:MAG TPA: NAD(P)-dependent oxidoreductase [Candidatus Baltobacteraceae bacterium]|nr:NAD(P)-dependent oxidoreductase [Candidatus Baltobacteraceae bacterium]
MEYPFVFFPVGLNLRGRRCIVIGDDREASEKAAALHEVGALVERIRDPAALRDEDLSDAFFVISTPQDAALSARLRALADRNRFLFCAIDQPRHGFVAMQAVAKAGPVRIAISTGGISPRVGRKLKEALQAALDASFVRFMDCLNAQRERNRSRLTSPKRREAMIEAAEGFDLEVRISYPRWFEESAARLRPEVRDAG